MQMSNIWRRRPVKYVKGNHRRTLLVGILIVWGYAEYV